MANKRRNSLDEMILWESLGTLISGGVPILHSLNIVRQSFPAYANEMMELYETNYNELPETFYNKDVRYGKKLADRIEVIQESDK